MRVRHVVNVPEGIREPVRVFVGPMAAERAGRWADAQREYHEVRHYVDVDAGPEITPIDPFKRGWDRG